MVGELRLGSQKSLYRIADLLISEPDRFSRKDLLND